MVALDELIQLSCVIFVPEIDAIDMNAIDGSSDALQLAFFKQSLLESANTSQIALQYLDGVSFGEYLEVELKGRQKGKERRAHVDIFIGEVPDGMFVKRFSIFVLGEGEVAKRVRSDGHESMSVFQRLLQMFSQRIVKQIRQEAIAKKFQRNVCILIDQIIEYFQSFELNGRARIVDQFGDGSGELDNIVEEVFVAFEDRDDGLQGSRVAILMTKVDNAKAKSQQHLFLPHLHLQY